MSIQLINTSGTANNYQLVTAGQSILTNASKAGVMFRVRIDGDPQQLAAGNYLVNGQFSTWYLCNWLAPLAGSVSLQLQLLGSTNASVTVPGLVAGHAYHVLMAWAPGAQDFFVDGVSVGTKSVTGNLNNISSRTHVIYGPPAGCPITVGDVALWNAYTPVLADAVALRDRLVTPATLAHPAQAWWSLDGTPGVAATTADPGLHDSIGSAHITTISGTGTAVYTDQLGARPVFRRTVFRRSGSRGFHGG